jgi:hypothetical protein
VTVILGTIGFALIAAAMNGAARMPLNPGALVVRRSAERPAPVLSGRLVPSHRALPGRPPAAGTAAPVYRITDAKEVTRNGP